MVIFVNTFVIIFGGLNMIAASNHMSVNKNNSILMMVGGLLAVLSIFLKIFLLRSSVYLLVLGFLCISIAAFLNGKQSGKLNIMHHIIRLFIEVVLVVLYVMF
ncbi:MAG: hypothetical protein MR283_07345 [Erysipelotrichaceae bacterium]|nr:hypothetical protein [Erysipelotrichaceae bacterium]